MIAPSHACHKTTTPRGGLFLGSFCCRDKHLASCVAAFANGRCFDDECTPHFWKMNVNGHKRRGGVGDRCSTTGPRSRLPVSLPPTARDVQQRRRPWEKEKNTTVVSLSPCSHCYFTPKPTSVHKSRIVEYLADHHHAVRFVTALSVAVVTCLEP